MDIAIIGAGNMGGATALGLASAFPQSRITVTARHSTTLERFAARGLQTSLDNLAAARTADPPSSALCLSMARNFSSLAKFFSFWSSKGLIFSDLCIMIQPSKRKRLRFP